MSNREDINKYYDLVNKYIDEYIVNHKITPSNLKKYFGKSAKVDLFLKKYKLEDVDGIKKIVSDVLEDRHASEKDGIMKFEKFILKENFGDIVIEESDIEYEKVLADVYHTSVGHVNVIDEKKHTYGVNDFGQEKSVAIYSNKDMEDLKSSLIPILIKSFESQSISLDRVNIGLETGEKVRTNISLGLGDVISKEKLSENISSKLNQVELIYVITTLLNDKGVVVTNRRYRYYKEQNGYHIWELKTIR